MRRLIGLAAAATVGLAACGGGSDAPTGSLGLPGSTAGAGAKIGAVPNGQPYIMSIGGICTNGIPVTVNKITATNATGNLQVFDWGVRVLDPSALGGPTPVDFANHVGYLHKVMRGFTRNPVKVDCKHPNGRYAEVDVNIKKSTDLAVVRNFVVHYSDGQQLTMPFQLVICSEHCNNVPWPKD